MPKALDEPIEPPGEVNPPDDGEDEGDAGPWVTVATFWQSTEAHLARIKLESEDIDCVIVDEFLIATDWLYANAIGGIKVQVPVARLAEARAALERPTHDDVPEKQVGTEDDASPDGGVSYASAIPECPACGSANTHRLRWSRRSAFLSLMLLGFPLPFLSRKRECHECGQEWTA